MPLRLETFARRNGADIGIIQVTGTLEIDKDTMSTHPLPPLKRHIVDILDEVAFDDLYPLRGSPLVIRGIHALGIAIYSVITRNALRLHAIEILSLSIYPPNGVTSKSSVPRYRKKSPSVALSVHRINETVALKLIHHREIHESLGFEVELLSPQAAVDHLLNPLQGGPVNPLEVASVFTPGSFQDLFVLELRKLGNDSLRELLIRPVPVHSPDKGPHEFDYGRAALRDVTPGRDHGAGVFFRGQIHQLSHAQLNRLEVKRKRHSLSIDFSPCHGGKPFRLPARLNNRDVFTGIEAVLFQDRAKNVIRRGAKAGDPDGLSLELFNVLDLRASYEVMAVNRADRGD